MPPTRRQFQRFRRSWVFLSEISLGPRIRVTDQRCKSAVGPVSSTQPTENPFKKSLPNPTQPNPTRGSTQTMDNSELHAVTDRALKIEVYSAPVTGNRLYMTPENVELSENLTAVRQTCTGKLTAPRTWNGTICCKQFSSLTSFCGTEIFSRRYSGWSYIISSFHQHQHKTAPCVRNLYKKGKVFPILVTERWARSWSRCTGSQPAGDVK